MCSLTMKHTRVVSSKCTPGFVCRAFSDTTLVCFIVNEHTTKCSSLANPYIRWYFISINGWMFDTCINTLGPRQNAISRTTFSSAFSWMKMHVFRLGFHWSLLRFELKIFRHWFRLWLGAGQATSRYLNQWWIIYWHIYASFGLNKLIGTYL